MKLQESSPIVQCREEDLKAVEGAIPKAQSKYKKQLNKEAPEVTIDRKHFLSKGAANDQQEEDPDAPTWCDASAWLLHLLHIQSRHHASLSTFMA